MRITSLLLAIIISFAVALPASAQSREVAELNVRIQQLEDQIRLLTGQVEGLQFQLAQMQTLIERQTEDNEFRFQQLEGGGAALPQQGNIGTERLAPSDPTTTAALPDPEPLGTQFGDPLPDTTSGDGLGDSSDPLLGTGSTGIGTLGTLDATAPRDLNLDGGVRLSSGDANAQYQAGYDAIMRGDYPFAEQQFEQFIALYPDDARAPDAVNWLGEALMQRGAFDDAALVLAEGYQRHASTPRAPDLMLKLGIAIAGSGDLDVACRTFFTLERRHTGLEAAFMQRLREEKSRANCPV